MDPPDDSHRGSIWVCESGSLERVATFAKSHGATALISISSKTEGATISIRKMDFPGVVLTIQEGHPALIGRHAPFPVTHQAAERHTAYFLVGGNEMTRQRQQVLNIDAHIGSVNDIAFSYPKKTLSIITCGNDKAIKVSKTMWLISQKIVQEELYVLNKFRCMMNSFSSGCSLLALGSNAVHKLWQWPCDERNPSGKSTASIAPQLRQPPNGILMTNERSDNNPEEATACIALSKNDSYATSASGGKVSLLNMRTFKEDVVDEYIDSCICGAKACSGGRPWSLACIIRGFKDRSEGKCLCLTLSSRYRQVKTSVNASMPKIVQQVYDSDSALAQFRSIAS
ncbi:hypothetical protein ZIOFF_012933 [Zingiber officinale]|uniref:Uncharacterized protein n=1 Tax=Zingiber officinale TaxID=94328 RepID=A0A8J5LNL0_ZINOF|nr:hypothetical protein ZIOFF_012933 [Zingiber officinale]